MRRLNEVSLRAYAQTEVILTVLLSGLVVWFTGATTATRKRSAKGLPGQATLEWVLIGGILVVIIVALLLTVFKPQIEAIMKNILQMVQNSTSGGSAS
ncbi:MAG TPA: hypothetical protein VH186_15505 [Chloroflexia bacterium]|nr:hypothetical protein [Chloroflexia bacterium]